MKPPKSSAPSTSPMVELSPAAIEDLRLLRDICAGLGTECVIIGAIAFQIHFPAQDRHTGNVDVAIALDLDDFPVLRNDLASRGWTQRKNMEHEWKSARGTRLDILLAGPKLRTAGSITWPESEVKMNLAGFGHVFQRAAPHEIAPGQTLRVIPPAVLATRRRGGNGAGGARSMGAANLSVRSCSPEANEAHLPRRWPRACRHHRVRKAGDEP